MCVCLLNCKQRARTFMYVLKGRMTRGLPLMSRRYAKTRNAKQKKKLGVERLLCSNKLCVYFSRVDWSCSTRTDNHLKWRRARAEKWKSSLLDVKSQKEETHSHPEASGATQKKKKKTITLAPYRVAFLLKSERSTRKTKNDCAVFAFQLLLVPPSFSFFFLSSLVQQSQFRKKKNGSGLAGVN